MLISLYFQYILCFIFKKKLVVHLFSKELFVEINGVNNSWK